MGGLFVAEFVGGAEHAVGSIEIGYRVDLANRACHEVAAQEPLSHEPAETAVHARNKPRSLCHLHL
jgi:hypothetical protein